MAYFISNQAYIGTGYLTQKIAAEDMKVAFTFTAQNTATARYLCTESSGGGAAGTVFRWGLQGDNAGVPDGSFLAAGSAWGSGAVADTYKGIGLKSGAQLTAGSVYHLVMEYLSGTVDATHWGAMHAYSTGALPVLVPRNFPSPMENFSDPNFKVQHYSGGTWLANASQAMIPFFIIGSAADGAPWIEGQTVKGVSTDGIWGAGSYFGEKIVATQDATINSIGFYLSANKTPKDSLYYSILEGANTLLTSGLLVASGTVTTSNGWYDANLASNIALTTGSTYRFVVYSPGADAGSYYRVNKGNGPVIGYASFYACNYAGASTGIKITTVNSGAAWTERTQEDYLFRLGSVAGAAPPTVYSGTNILDGRILVPNILSDNVVDSRIKILNRSSNNLINARVVKKFSENNVVEARIKVPRSAQKSIEARIKILSLSSNKLINARIKQVSLSSNKSIEARIKVPRNQEKLLNGRIKLSRSAQKSIEARIKKQFSDNKLINSRVKVPRSSETLINARVNLAGAAFSSTKSLEARIKILSLNSQNLLNARTIFRSSNSKLLNARIKKMFSSEELINARVKKSFSGEKILKARIKLSRSDAKLLNARVKKKFSSELSSEARIKKQFSQNKSIEARIKKQFSGDKLLNARLKKGFSSEELLNARIKKSFSQNKVCDARIVSRGSADKRFNARIKVPSSNNCLVNASISVPVTANPQLTRLLDERSFSEGDVRPTNERGFEEGDVRMADDRF